MSRYVDSDAPQDVYVGQTEDVEETVSQSSSWEEHVTRTESKTIEDTKRKERQLVGFIGEDDPDVRAEE